MRYVGTFCVTKPKPDRMLQFKIKLDFLAAQIFGFFLISALTQHGKAS
jgi:hypothetical protein